MASRLYKQFLYSANHYPVFIEGSFQVGASGVVAGSSGLLITPTSAILGAGIAGVYKGGTGQYVIQLSDNFNRFLDFQAVILSPTSSGPAQDGILTVGKPYQIIFPSSSTNWVTLGVPAGITPVYGLPFVATSGASAGPLSSSAGVAGNGTVCQILSSGVESIEVLPNPNCELGSSIAGRGAVINIQTLGGASSAIVPVNPTSGTTIRFNITMRNSTVLGPNEITLAGPGVTNV